MTTVGNEYPCCRQILALYPGLLTPAFVACNVLTYPGLCFSTRHPPDDQIHYDAYDNIYQVFPHISTASDKHCGVRPGCMWRVKLVFLCSESNLEASLASITVFTGSTHHIIVMSQDRNSTWRWELPGNEQTLTPPPPHTHTHTHTHPRWCAYSWKRPRNKSIFQLPPEDVWPDANSFCLHWPHGLCRTGWGVYAIVVYYAFLWFVSQQCIVHARVALTVDPFVSLLISCELWASSLSFQVLHILENLLCIKIIC